MFFSCVYLRSVWPLFVRVNVMCPRTSTANILGVGCGHLTCHRSLAWVLRCVNFYFDVLAKQCFFRSRRSRGVRFSGRRVKINFYRDFNVPISNVPWHRSLFCFPFIFRASILSEILLVLGVGEKGVGGREL